MPEDFHRLTAWREYPSAFAALLALPYRFTRSSCVTTTHCPQMGTVVNGSGLNHNAAALPVNLCGHVLI